DTALPKKGERSVGVARQYCGALGKRANCQALVSLTLARGEVPLPLGLRLFLPDEWTADPERCARAGVPEEHRHALTKPDLALAAWHRSSWRLGTKGPLAAEFAALRVRPAEGAQLRNGWHLPGDEVLLVGEHRASGERKYYLSNLPAETSLEELAATIKARWV